MSRDPGLVYSVLFVIQSRERVTIQDFIWGGGDLFALLWKPVAPSLLPWNLACIKVSYWFRISHAYYALAPFEKNSKWNPAIVFEPSCFMGIRWACPYREVTGGRVSWPSCTRACICHTHQWLQDAVNKWNNSTLSQLPYMKKRGNFFKFTLCLNCARMCINTTR